MRFSTLALVIILAEQAYAHGFVTHFKTDDVDNGGYLLNYYYQKKNGQAVPKVAAWSAENLDSGFIAPDNYTSPDIVCSINSEPAGTTAEVKAGGIVSFTWNKWAHFGPVMTYVARCDGNCSTVDKTKLKFIKIDEAGIDFDTQEWAARKMVSNNLTWVTNVPKTLAPGNYVFRHETIAVHGSLKIGGAQNYPQCFNIAIIGSGTAKPEGVLATELYKPTDAGIFFNPYVKKITNYTIPGPALFVDGESKASASANVSSASILPSATAGSGVNTTAATSKAAATTTHVRASTFYASGPKKSDAEKPTHAPTPTSTVAASHQSPSATSSQSPVAFKLSAAASTQPASPTAVAPDSQNNKSYPALPKGFDLQAFIEWIIKVGEQNNLTRRHPRHLIQ